MQHVGKGVYKHTVPIDFVAEGIKNFISDHEELEIVSFSCVPYGHCNKRSWLETLRKGPLMSPSFAELVIVTRQ